MKAWRWPLLLAVLTVVGLLSALLAEEGPFWFVSWTALSVPLLAIGFAVIRSMSDRIS